ncbi:Pet127-domain-containing protein [Daedalea quercina L-15889]|uniref:Pet127-domain-containing protein n=1 Tax=Daedalea quercina L-15889 TaxID=1314783 RepID=A0A165TP79_9APHY|nr:Pet127-domain-containing protein [Daedalea quercina L-15889]
MRRARHLSLKPLRPLISPSIHRAFSDTTKQNAETPDREDEDKNTRESDLLHILTNIAQCSKEEPRVEFQQLGHESISHGPLQVELPETSEEPPWRMLSEKLRKRSTWKSSLPRLVGDHKHRHGLLSPFDSLPLQDVPGPFSRIPRLEHDLATVLTNPGVHWLTDPRTGHDNFPSYLGEVPNTSEFAFERLKGFIPSSRDHELLKRAARHGCTFAGSTSSVTGMLSHIYLLMAEDKTIDVSTLSAHYQTEAKTFTPGQRMPISVSLKYKDGVYATDSDVDHTSQLGATETILSQLGIVMEKFFTMKLSQFNKVYLRENPPPLNALRWTPRNDAYRYAMHNKLMLRAQLDCRSPVLPGTGVFDIKTRAAVPIRYDMKKYRDNVREYRINTIRGPWMSFEKEYYDLIRSAFLKYSFQARIGDMDGVFVAYHNTHEIFGFQYIPLEEMDQRLFGHDQGQRIFGKCVGLLEVLFGEIVKYFPEKNVNCTWETSLKKPIMRIWIEPARWHDPQKPVVQLDVKLTHYLGSKKVTGAQAVSSRSGGWTIAYTIAQSTQSRATILKLRREAFNRQLRIFKYNLSANERVERGQDVDLSHIDPLTDAEVSDVPAVFDSDSELSVDNAKTEDVKLPDTASSEPERSSETSPPESLPSESLQSGGSPPEVPPESPSNSHEKA